MRRDQTTTGPAGRHSGEGGVQSNLFERWGVAFVTHQEKELQRGKDARHRESFWVKRCRGARNSRSEAGLDQVKVQNRVPEKP